MKITYNSDISKYVTGDKVIETDNTLEISDRVSKQTYFTHDM